MFDYIDPDENTFEVLKQFCFLISEGRVEPQKVEMHYMNLYHPTVPEATLIVHYSTLSQYIYIRELVEGRDLTDIEGFPLVHSFPVDGSRDMFPFAVDVRANHHNVWYHYDETPSGGSNVQVNPRKQYLRLKLMFDEKNPHPWEEKKE